MIKLKKTLTKTSNFEVWKELLSKCLSALPSIKIIKICERKKKKYLVLINLVKSKTTKNHAAIKKKF